MAHRPTHFDLRGLQERSPVHQAGEGVRAGKGPILLEMKTYRYRGPAMSDPAKYRSREEVAAVREKSDPLEHAKARLIEMGAADEASLKKLDQDIRAQITAAADFAETAPYDLMLLDVLLPGPNCLAVCRALRRRGPRTPVLFLTARDAVDDRLAGMDAGADDYLVIPFSLRSFWLAFWRSPQPC